MSDISPEKIDQHVVKLANAVEKTYGSPWHVIWRNFLAGIARALGVAFGYIVVIGALIFMAQKLGLFKTVQNFWQDVSLQIQELKGFNALDPEM
jgi:hypothetical protein